MRVPNPHKALFCGFPLSAYAKDWTVQESIESFPGWNSCSVGDGWSLEDKHKAPLVYLWPFLLRSKILKLWREKLQILCLSKPRREKYKKPIIDSKRWVKTKLIYFCRTNRQPSGSQDKVKFPLTFRGRKKKKIPLPEKGQQRILGKGSDT